MRICWVIITLTVFWTHSIGMHAPDHNYSPVLVENDGTNEMLSNIRMSVSAYDDHNMIEWLFNGVINPDCVILLQRSFNGEEFISIGRYTSDYTNYFKFADFDNQKNGVYAYRVMIRTNLAVKVSYATHIELKDRNFYDENITNVSPFHNSLQLNFTRQYNTPDELLFYDNGGKLVHSKKTFGRSIHFYTFSDTTKKGEYFAEFKTESGETKRFRFVLDEWNF